MREDELPVFSGIPVAGVTPVIIMSPHSSFDVDQYTPKNFLVYDGKLVPYEYSTSTSRVDITQYKPFTDRVIDIITEENANYVFGLIAFPHDDSDNALSEFEMPELRTTVMVPPSLLQLDGVMKEIATNWTAPRGSGPQAIAAAYCGRRTNGHARVSGYCQTRTRGHTTVSPIGPEGTPSEDSEITYAPGSPMARVVLAVQSYVAVAA